MFQQEVHEQSHPRRHRRAADEHRMNRFLVPRVPGFQQRYQVAALQILDAGAMSLLHRPIGADEDQGRQAIETLAQAHAGLLDLQSIIDNAAMLREGKHRIITLGCIAAQLYDGLRDVASLRSLAAWYAQQRLPVPLDIILYGGGTLDEVDGQLVADIAPVARSHLVYWR